MPSPSIKIKDSFQYLKEISLLYYSEFRYSNTIVDYFLTLLRWSLFSVPPLYIGVYGKIAIEKQLTGKFDLATILDLRLIEFLGFWPLFLASLLWFLGTLWRIDNNRKDISHDRVYHVLWWMYQDLGFYNNKEADIRCTLWTPKKSTSNYEKLRLIQLVDYVPDLEISSNRQNVFRRNMSRGRVRMVARKKNKDIEPIGIVGKCAVESIRDNNAYILMENISDDKNFIDRMINIWHFTKTEAKKLTQDRKSYICISLMTSNHKDLLGLIYMDSNQENIFNDKIVNEIQEYLPRISEVLF